MWAGCKETTGAVQLSGARRQLCSPPVILEGCGEDGAAGRFGQEHTAGCCSWRVDTLPPLSFNPPALHRCPPWADSPRSHRAGELTDVIFCSQHAWQDEGKVCSGRGRAPAQLHPFYPSVNTRIFCLSKKFLFPSHGTEEVPSARTHC